MCPLRLLHKKSVKNNCPFYCYYRKKYSINLQHNVGIVIKITRNPTKKYIWEHEKGKI